MRIPLAMAMEGKAVTVGEDLLGWTSDPDAGEVVTVIVIAKVSTDNDLIGSVQTEIQVRVEGKYEVQLQLP